MTEEVKIIRVAEDDQAKAMTSTFFSPNRCLFSIAHTGKNVQNIDMVKHKMETKIKFGTTTYTIVDSLKCCVLRQSTNQVSESRQ